MLFSLPVWVQRVFFKRFYMGGLLLVTAALTAGTVVIVALGYEQGGFYVTAADAMLLSVQNFATWLSYPALFLLVMLPMCGLLERPGQLLLYRTKGRLWRSLCLSGVVSSLLLCLAITAFAAVSACAVANKWEITDEARNIFVVYTKTTRAVSTAAVFGLFLVRLFLLSLIIQQAALLLFMVTGHAALSVVPALAVCIYDYFAPGPQLLFRFLAFDFQSVQQPGQLLLSYRGAVVLYAALVIIGAFALRKKEFYG